MKTKASNTTSKKWQGWKWIRADKRLAIYLRDGLSCCYCGATVEDGVTKLSLDHIKPRSKGGGNGEKNLVTSCTNCNSSRGNRPISKFCSPESLAFIRRTTKRKLGPYRKSAKAIISSRKGQGFSTQVMAAHDTLSV